MPSEESDRTVVEALLDRVDQATDPERELLQYVVERAGKQKPELAELLRACAIPRRFDAEIVGLLREDGVDRESDDELLQFVVRHSFVRTRSDGSYSYDEVSRRILLEDWRTPERRDRFDDLNLRLAGHYREAHARARQREAGLRRVGAVVRQANPARHLQLLGVIDDLLVAPMLEELYHEAQRSPEAAYETFLDYCVDYEGRGRLILCQTLLQATRKAIDELPAVDPSISRWLRYWEGRLARGVREEAKAEALQQSLLAETAEDVKLRIWVLSELTLVQQQQDKLAEAMATASTELSLAEATQTDPFNLNRSYRRLGDIQMRLDQHERALSSYEFALSYARQFDDAVGEAGALLGLSYERSILGREEEAFETALQALHLVRTRLRTDPASQQMVGSYLASLLAGSEPHLADTAFAEVEALGDAVDDPLGGLGYRKDYVDALRGANRPTRAEKDLARLVDQGAERIDERLRSSLLFSAGLLCELQGRVDESIEAYSAVVERAELGLADLWDEAAALSNRGMERLQAGDVDEAEADLTAATERWRRIGHETLAALMQVKLGEARLVRGDHGSAEALVESTRATFSDSTSPYAITYFRVRGEIARKRAKWEPAAESYERAVALSRSVGDRASATDNLLELARIASAQGAWADAARWAGEAEGLLQALGELDAQEVSEEAQAADLENGRGLQFLTEDALDPEGQLLRARDLFQSAAARVPSNPLYRLNLAYAWAELSEWADAAEALQEIAKSEGLPPAFVRRLLADYRLKEGDALIEANQVPEAEEAYRSGLADAQALGDARLTAHLSVRVALASARHRNLGEASAHLRKGIEALRSLGDSEAEETLIGEAVNLVASVPQLRRLGSVLESLHADR